MRRACPFREWTSIILIRLKVETRLRRPETPEVSLTSKPRIGPGSQADGRRPPARGLYPGTVTDMPVAQRVKTGRYLS